MMERKRSKKCEKQGRRSSETQARQRERGSSPTVREGVCLFCDLSTPSLTVGLLPYCLLLTAHCFYRQRCLQSSFASFALRSQVFRAFLRGMSLQASFLIR